MKLRLSAIALSVFMMVAACGGAEGLAGPIGPAGTPGRDGANGTNGKDGVSPTVDYTQIYDRVRTDLPVLVDSAIAREPLPGVNTDSLAKVVAALVPAGPKGDKGDPGAKGDKGDPGAAAVIPTELVIDKLRVQQICVGVLDCLSDDPAQLQISGTGATISFRANTSQSDAQSSCIGYSTIGMSPDLGTRLIQNERWTTSGQHIQWICGDHGQAAVGFDSQADFSFNNQAPGEADIGTQLLTIRHDPISKEVYFALWKPGWKLGVRASGDGCMWCENLRWTFPTQ